jgi:hypothetical protein
MLLSGCAHYTNASVHFFLARLAVIIALREYYPRRLVYGYTIFFFGLLTPLAWSSSRYSKSIQIRKMLHLLSSSMLPSPSLNATVKCVDGCVVHSVAEHRVAQQRQIWILALGA